MKCKHKALSLATCPACGQAVSVVLEAQLTKALAENEQLRTELAEWKQVFQADGDAMRALKKWQRSWKKENK